MRFLLATALMYVIFLPQPANGQEERSYYLGSLGLGLPNLSFYTVPGSPPFLPGNPGKFIEALAEGYLFLNLQLTIQRPQRLASKYIEYYNIMSIYPYTGYAFGWANTSRWHYLGAAIGPGLVPIYNTWLVVAAQGRIIVFPTKHFGFGASWYYMLKAGYPRPPLKGGLTFELVVREDWK